MPSAAPKRGKALNPHRQELLEFNQIAASLLQDARVRRMEQFIQHGDTSCLRHCIAVAWYSFLLYRRLGLHGQEVSLVRGALLHDFFLYDWHLPGHPPLHGFFHPDRAAQNAQRYLGVNALEAEIIRRHMWPLTLIPPRHLPALIVSLADKYCTVREVTGHSYPSFLPR